MLKTTPDTLPADSPLLHDENGALSLHFGFPTIQSSMLKADPDRLILDYTRTMMGFLLLHPTPKRIAMIGLGGGSLAKYCYRKLPACDFTTVELSPEVIALRAQFGIPADDARFRVICADGADFVRGENAAFDVLLVDGFDRGGQPRQLCSSAFYDACRAILRDSGILVVNLCADDAECSNYINRIREAFDGKVITVDADEGENRIVFACNGGHFPPSFSELTERLRALEATHPVDLDKTAQRILHPPHPRRVRRKNQR